ncbi:ubiquinol-cytochrome C chaperone family protein [Asticcacaulis sp. EMRT-3]|uniref:ubiquinol-cytochrome C chaperone family protein n=1 Tax=Asticcacaulis sp. EMRT-3 TaxID=3040349 RepID=UPI0024AF2E9D|nr:ubiquinol-cytochrome C chaperone family protein [Asticcacaulis sp. EMRT-3]MDI7774413.1 ubiquinol-cytochrome C chaperone family protein [Asticcacaulis sp. EMRT-3]
MQPFLNIVQTLFGRRPPRLAKAAGERLYAQCVERSRLPVFYLDYGVADEIGARFELLTFHIGMVVHALRAVQAEEAGFAQAQETAQALFDSFLLALDTTLREQGTGDLAVPKKMKTLGQIIYTRMKRWDELWLEGEAAQVDYALRTIYAGSAYAGPGNEDEAEALASAAKNSGGQALSFAAYARAVRVALRAEDIMNGRLSWPEPVALEAA